MAVSGPIQAVAPEWKDHLLNGDIRKGIPIVVPFINPDYHS